MKKDSRRQIKKNRIAKVETTTGIDTSNFTLEPNLASLRIEVDKLNIDKLVPVPFDLSKLSV